MRYHRCFPILILALLPGCVGQELRRVSTLTAAEVQGFDTALARFDRAHRAVIGAIDARAAGDRGIARATDDIVAARITELVAGGQDDAVRLFTAAAPPIPDPAAEPPPIAVPARDGAAQAKLLAALGKVSAPRSERRSAELLLGFALDVARSMKKDADAAATPSE